MLIKSDDVLAYLANEYNENNHEEAGNFEAGARFVAIAAINFVNSLVDAAEKAEVSGLLVEIDERNKQETTKASNA